MAAESMRGKRREKWRRVHRWLAFGAGGFFAFMGLSGGVLIFRDSLDAICNPALYQQAVSADGRNASFQAVVDAALEGSEGWYPVALDWPRFGGPARVYLASPSAMASDEWREVFVDRYTARRLGVRRFGNSLVQTVYRLHDSLMIGTVGRYAIGMVGVLFATSLLTGTVLWWPSSTRWRSAVGIKAHAGVFRQLFDWHRTVGVIAVPVLIAIVATGIYLAFQSELQPLLDKIQPSAPERRSIVSTASTGKRISVDRAIAAALRRLPEATFGYLEFPETAEASFAVSVRQPREASYLFTRSTVWVDQYSSSVLWVRDAHRVPALLAVEDWIFPIHDGQALNQEGRVLYAAIGLSPSLLLCTGLTMWAYKRRASRRRA